MKNIHKILYIALVFVISSALSSCEDYLDVVPKGQKIPETLDDFEALLRDEYTVHVTNIAQANILLNNVFVSSSSLNDDLLSKANYNWDENADRIKLNEGDETTYYNLYAAISNCNLVIESVPSSTGGDQAKKNEVIANAKIIRSMCYYVLTNFYADTYEASDAASKLSVPLITSALVGAPYRQVTILEMYDFIISNVKETIESGDLQAQGMTVLHPGLGAANAFLARVYLQMQNYDEALKYANIALSYNDKLYDWTAYYATYQSQIEDPAVYTKSMSPAGFDYIENYNFRHGSTSRSGSESNINVTRAEQFEEGDARFLSRWKIFTSGENTYYKSINSGFYNYGGMTTVEVYLIKAECLARSGDISGAMDLLNTVRKTRILADYYADAEAANEQQAIELIRRTRDNELMLTIVPFADARRFNLDEKYARTLTKNVDGVTVDLHPDSNLWTMPFPAGAIKNPGNGSIIQNVNN